MWAQVRDHYHILRAFIETLGASMGGLLAADTLREFVRTRPDQSAPLWPNIVACFAFDTPVSQAYISCIF